MMTNDLLQRLYLDDNGLSDEKLSLLTHGLMKQTSLKALTIQSNHVGQLAVEEIVNLVKRKPPSILEELHLINTKGDW